MVLSLSVAGEVRSQDLETALGEHYRAAAQEKMSGIETTFASYQARPDRIWVESDYQGSEVIQTCNGKEGWIYAPVMGILTVRPSPPSRSKSRCRNKKAAAV